MTGIIATLGPVSATKEMITKLHDAGVTIFRFNFAHESFESAGQVIKVIRHNRKKALDTA